MQKFNLKSKIQNPKYCISLPEVPPFALSLRLFWGTGFCAADSKTQIQKSKSVYGFTGRYRGFAECG